MTAKGRKPLIGLPACVYGIEDQDYHAVGEKYLVAALRAAGGLPVTIPALGHVDDLPDLVERLDGLLITGSPSNVEPHHYDGSASADGTSHDAARDSTTLPLIRLALDAGLPLLALCRGHQELNVILGGTLHQRVHELPGKMNHQADPSLPIGERYGPAHPVTLTPGGSLAALAEGLADDQGRIMVNSLHSQAIDRLADGLVVEAVAEDGIIEAVRVDGSKAMALGIQWHPEWRVPDNPFSIRLFDAFGAAARARANRTGGLGARKSASQAA